MRQGRTSKTTTKKLIELVGRLPRFILQAIGGAVIVAVGIVDHVTGPSVSLSLFYVVPIAFVTWYGGVAFGLFCALLSTGLVTWEEYAWFPDIPWLISVWNAVSGLVNFSSVAVVIHYVHKLYHIRVKEVEDKYTRIVESTIEGVIATDLDGTIQFVNSRAAAMLGFLTSSIVGKQVVEFVSDEPSQQIVRTLVRNQKQTTTPVEIQFMRVYNRPMWGLVSANVSKDELGAINGMVLLVTDISERKKSEDALRESEQDYRTLVERMKEGLLRVDDQDRMQFVNDAFCDMVGYTREELIGRVASDVLLSGTGRMLLEEKHVLLRLGVSDIYDLQLQRKTGEQIWVRVSGAPVLDVNGNVVGSIGVHTDITLQKLADEKLHRRYEEISAMQRLSSVLAQSVHLDRRLEAALDTVLDLMKYDGGTIFMFDEEGNELVLQHQRGLPPKVVELTERWPAGKGMIGRVALTGIPSFAEDEGSVSEIDPAIREMARLRAVGDVPLESKGKVLGVMTVFLNHPHKFSENERLMLLAFGKQIGIALENARLYEMGREREQHVRRLSIELVRVQEDERKRFARELHDGLSQVLTTLKINTELAAKHFSLDPHEAERYLKEALKLVDEAQSEAKELAYDLRPAILDDFGLKAAIAVLASSFERRTGVTVEFIAPMPDERFDSLLETSIYRIVQELLTNVAKHASATRISIQFLLRENTLVLEVTDNGKGLDLVKGKSTTPMAAHFGLRNIRERVEFFGGSFRTESLVGHGTEIMIEVPVSTLLLQPPKQNVGG